MSEASAQTAGEDLTPPRCAPLLTFGYGARSLSQVVRLLGEHRVQFVVDVRSVPWSRFRPDFSQDQLADALRAHDIRYLFMGIELGGRPDDAECYDLDGRVDYRACARRPAFCAGIDRLTAASGAGHRIAIMCSEGRPEDCHRTKLVSPALIEAGVDVRHLDERGHVRSHDEVLDRIRGPQMALIGEDDPLAKSRGRYRVSAR